MLKLLALPMICLSLSAQASEEMFFKNTDAEVARGTEKAIELANETGHPVMMIFGNKFDQNGNPAAVVVSPTPNAEAPAQEPAAPAAKNVSKKSTPIYTGLAFDMMFGRESAPKFRDEKKNNPIVSPRFALRLFNGRVEAYTGYNASAEDGDELRFGGRAFVHKWFEDFSYDAEDDWGGVYVYLEGSPGNPNKGNLVANTPTNIDLRHSIGAGFKLQIDNGFGVIFEGGAAFYKKVGVDGKQRGRTISIGFVKNFANRKRN